MKLYKKVKLIFDKKFENEKKDKFIKFLIFVIGVIFIGMLSKILGVNMNSLTTIIVLFFLSILFIIIWIKAGMSIFKSLFIAGAGFSLIIFIAQEYCKVPMELRISDSSLKVFIGFGLFYTIIIFIGTLYKELFGDKNSENDLNKKGTFKIFREINNGKDHWLVLLIYAIVFGVFLGQIFQVLYPIVNNICIYK